MWRDWLLRAVAGSPSEMQIMYGPAGERRLTELVLDWPGYEGSAPVRIGNAASDQFQLDVFGELMDALLLGRQGSIEADDAAWRLQLFGEPTRRRLGAARRGIWEVRGKRRQRALQGDGVGGVRPRDRLVEQCGHDGPVERWRELRGRLHREVCERGFDAERGTFRSPMARRRWTPRR